MQCDLAQKVIAEYSELQEDDLSEDLLLRYCEVSDLSLVTRLDIQVDAAMQRLEAIGQHLPSLRELRLSDSCVLCMRELGVALERLEVLWMSRCGLQELDGVSVMPELRELYIPFNDVVDISPLKELEHLTVLDIEGNAVGDLMDLADLRVCQHLRELTLTGNPVAAGGDKSRQAVLDMIPQLAVLDDRDRGCDAAPSTIAPGPDLLLDLYLESDVDLYLDLYASACASGAGAGSGAASRTDEEEDENCGRGDPHRAGDDAHCKLYGEQGGEASSSSSRRLSSLLAAGLREGQATDLYADEPDEHELVVERLKRARPRPAITYAAPHSARLAARSSGFDLQLAPRPLTARGGVGAAGAVPASPRPATGCPASARGGGGCGHDDDPSRGSAYDSSSELTCGGSGSLAGNPMAALRQRRSQEPALAATDGGLGIRELLRWRASAKGRIHEIQAAPRGVT